MALCISTERIIVANGSIRFLKKCALLLSFLTGYIFKIIPAYNIRLKHLNIFFVNAKKRGLVKLPLK
jgi:hypothetical protein